jgi:hypothetical protein
MLIHPERWKSLRNRYRRRRRADRPSRNTGHSHIDLAGITSPSEARHKRQKRLGRLPLFGGRARRIFLQNKLRCVIYRRPHPWCTHTFVKILIALFEGFARAREFTESKRFVELQLSLADDTPEIRVGDAFCLEARVCRLDDGRVEALPSRPACV